ncbi:MAG: hypothetical protein ACXVEF_40000 [Polyangiales bacterium]
MATAKVAWLAEADAALRSGDARGALRTLLSAWRELRSPVLAEAIEELSAFVTKDAPALVGKRLTDKVAAWNARAEAADPADFGVLAQNLFLVNSGKEVGAHLEKLGEWPADPRVSSLLHELALKVPFTATSARPFWRALFAVLPKIGDPRTPAALDAADEKFAQVFAGREDYLTYLPNQTKKVRAALHHFAAHPLDDATVAGLAAMRAFVAEKAKPTRSAAQLSSLLDAVYEDPTADAPREVLADALLDASDPRGEFIALQMGEARGRTLSREEKRREKQLLDAHADEWLGPLAGWIRKGDRAFRRGFLARCTIEQKGRNAGPFPDTPVWATVEDAMAVNPLDVAALRRLRAVKRLRGLSQQAFVEAAREPSIVPHLEEILVVGTYTPERFEAIGDAPGLPALRRLRYIFRGTAGQGEPDVRALLGAFHRLERLTWIRVEIGLATDNPAYYTRGVDVALAREHGDVVAHVRLHSDGRPFDARLAVLRELALRAPFITRTKVVAWEYPNSNYERVSLKRVQATDLPEVELVREVVTGEQAADHDNQV